jgi:hypothetical protein
VSSRMLFDSPMFLAVARSVSSGTIMDAVSREQTGNFSCHMSAIGEDSFYRLPFGWRLALEAGRLFDHRSRLDGEDGVAPLPAGCPVQSSFPFTCSYALAPLHQQLDVSFTLPLLAPPPWSCGTRCMSAFRLRWDDN